MSVAKGSSPRLLAVSDLHVGHPENRTIVAALRPEREGDWLIVAGDLGETIAEIEWSLDTLTSRFAKVIWTPGNHDLWTLPDEFPALRGESRYRRLVELCRARGVLTPEDPYLVWEGESGPLLVAPVFLLYDYSFGRDDLASRAQALAQAERVGVLCSDEFLLHPDPYHDRAEWCHARVRHTEERLRQCPADVPLALVNHFPLTEHPTAVLRHPEFAMWCGTRLTDDWHRRFDVAVVVYGHLHIPRTTWRDGVRFEEVSLGNPREWRLRAGGVPFLRTIAPFPSPPA
ncbi:MAG TPA: metallophosphoesterase [Solirubrobacteraceae bacterium]|nr:metallophosphoesterase [Solirubrobacteraceae bacterium]